MKEIVIFYWVKSENQNCSCNSSPHPQKHVGKRSGGGGGLVLFFKWEAAEHSQVDEIGWELKSLSLGFLILYTTGCSRHQRSFVHSTSYTCVSNQNAPSSPKSRLRLQYQALQLCPRDTHKMPFNLKLAYCRKTESTEKVAPGSCWNKPFFLSSIDQVEKKKKVYQILTAYSATISYFIYQYCIIVFENIQS